MIDKDNVRFAIPIDLEKGKNSKGEEIYKFSGLASTTNKDNQGEELLANQFDLSNFKQVNWNHKAKDNPDAVLGEIEKHYFGSKNGKRGLYVDGELYPEMPMTKGVVALAKALKKRGKTLQLSVEGQVLQRGHKDPKNPLYNKIVKAKLLGVAITPNAVNGDTFMDLLEKGYTNNEWQYDSETEELVKAMEAGSITGTETTNKVTSAESLKVEDLEGAKHTNENCKVKNCDQCKSLSENKNFLSKSLAYENIFTYFYNIDVKKATQIYQLAEKISNMTKTKISEETLKKAFEIINIASQEVEKDNLEKSVNEAVELIKTDDYDDLEKSEVIEKLEKSGFDKKVAEEAAEKEKPKKKKKVESKKEEKSDEDKDTDSDDMKKEIKKSFEALSLKTEEFQNSSDLKLGAIGVILKSQSDTIEALMKSNEQLSEVIANINDQVEKISKTPVHKNTITARGIERFEKSEEGFSTFNLKNKLQRKALSDKLENLSGFNKANQNDGKYDEELFKAAQDIELLHVIGNPRTLQYLEDVHKIKVINGVE